MAYETTSTTSAHQVTCDVCGRLEYSITDGFGAPVYPEGWKRVQLEWAPPVASGPTPGYGPPWEPPPKKPRYPDEIEPYYDAGRPQITHMVERPNLSYRAPEGWEVRSEPRTVQVHVIKPGAGRVAGDVCPTCQQNLTLASIMEAFELRRQQAAPATSRDLPQAPAGAPPPPWSQ
jgi:hypothetical protein